MKEATEVPMICYDCGGTLTDDSWFSVALGEESAVYWHMEHSQCITSLNERLTLATQRAEAAEARRHVWEQRARMGVRERRALRVERDALLVVNGDLARDNETLEAECEALRKDVARLVVDDEMVDRAWKYLEIIAIEKSYGMLSGIDKEYLRNALTAALAVQP